LLKDERRLLARASPAPRKRGVLLYPNTYAVGMSSLATHTLYALLNADPDLSCERAFVDSPGAESLTLESGARLADFDFIAVTSSFELDWTVLPAVLTAGGVPPLQRDRSDGPLVLVGGPAITAAPLPLSAIYDAAFIGEIEPVADDLRAALLEGSPAATLERLAATPGFYVPGTQEPVAPRSLPRRCAASLEGFDTTSVILTPHAEFADRFLVEVGRGCGRGCSFCLARQVYSPARWRPLGQVMAALEQGLTHTRKVGLVAAAVSDYPELDGLCAGLKAIQPEVQISTSSVRAESASTPLLSLLAKGGQRTVTFAPEAATETLRRRIGKTMPEEALLAAVDRAQSAGLDRVRLYFMVGLPGETESDRAEIVALAERLQGAFTKVAFRLNVGVFSPRPHTPFEHERVPPLAELKSWLARLGKDLRRLPRVDASTESARYAALQCAFSRSDERLGVALAALTDRGFPAVAEAMMKQGLNLETLAGWQEDRPDQPWKVVDPHCAG
jgi:radical SAM superfamily enzyme YgiQ (UPF0313 family)